MLFLDDLKMEHVLMIEYNILFMKTVMSCICARHVIQKQIFVIVISREGWAGSIQTKPSFGMTMSNILRPIFFL